MAEYIDRKKLIDDFTGSGGLTVYGKYVPAIVYCGTKLKMEE